MEMSRLRANIEKVESAVRDDLRGSVDKHKMELEALLEENERLRQQAAHADIAVGEISSVVASGSVKSQGVSPFRAWPYEWVW